MRAPKVTWNASNAAFVGPHRVGDVRPALADRRRAGQWKAYCALPGCSIPLTIEYQSTPRDARKIVELAVKKWFEAIE